MSRMPYQETSDLCRWALMLRGGRTACAEGTLRFFGSVRFQSARKPLDGGRTLVRLFSDCLSLQMGGLLIEGAEALYLDPLQAGIYIDRGTAASAQLKAAQLRLALVQQLGEPVYTHSDRNRCLAVLPCEPASREPDRCGLIQAQIASALSLALRRVPGQAGLSNTAPNQARTPGEEVVLDRIA